MNSKQLTISRENLIAALLQFPPLKWSLPKGKDVESVKFSNIDGDQITVDVIYTEEVKLTIY